jgi:hypothetical protein
MMSRPHLRLVEMSSQPNAAQEQPCGWCAFIVIALFFGLFWWPFFYWMYH